MTISATSVMPVGECTTPLIDLSSLLDAPHDRLAALRATHAVVSSGDMQYIALRAADILKLLADPRTIAVPGAEYVKFKNIPDGSTARMLHDVFLLDNGVSHRTKRGLFARTFSHRSIKDQRPSIRHVADRLVQALPRGEDFDFVEHMAAPLPAAMIAAMLGLPDGEIGYFTARVYSVSRIFTSIYPLEDHDEIETAARELVTYVMAHLIERQQNPGDDLLSALLTEWRATKSIPFDNLVHQIILLIIAGSDTTRAAFAMLVSLLLQHREQWQMVKADPALIQGAVLEALRYEPAVGSMPRLAMEPLTVGGTHIPAGAMISIQNLSAMRDPALYEDPDRFDITRDDHPRLHLVFGAGAHRCLGEMLARLEMEEGLSALLAAAPHIELIEPPRMIGLGGIRQITPMTVRID